MSRPSYSAPKAFGQVVPSVLPHTAYQVDYAAANCGRIIPASKRHIRFKFGYSNIKALSKGQTGQDCRGSEHEVSVTWSLSSGKQAIAFDRYEVFFDVGDSTQTKFSHSWKDERGHSLEVIIHAASMSTKSNPDPDWKQYDLIVDGVSFFHMPKIFEIGIFPKDDVDPKFAQVPKFARHSSRVSQSAHDGRFVNISKNNMEPILPPDESKKQPEPAEVANLLSFGDFDNPAPAEATSVSPVQAQTQNHYIPPQAQAWSSYAPTQTPAQTSFAFAQAPEQTKYSAPQQICAPSCTPFLNSHTQDREDTNYISPTTSPGYSGNKCMAQTPFAFYPNGTPSNVAVDERDVAPTSSSYASHPNPVTPPDSSIALGHQSSSPTSYYVNGAMKTLVNVDNLFGSVASPFTRESINEKSEDENSHKSLGQLKGSNSRNAKDPVMNPFNSAPVYEQQAQYSGYANQQPQQQYSSYGY
mmetsp:Transcript_8656/g.18624  ORF Transcript_8656/g.18624 Transcript_8656/m.18624 type:complete len:469 (-) Transcript_8656:233-1639(-)|eukprot:CAMPEP_0172556806 /NCGR_PEP_ID=MMETSP1067-20121228/69179_1 /TAXON_ID=265564 ORGANISM="Thalassiosira punctigera, Strain Tpunct2005C2" /NCGR_SAMPLE_ID=MMETSP1067 /ASSEMBLY_ACC=CAM_ASM_000444 /LENGTH=468 /DNA_ID=CAMNT_0013345709 /DNA_START=156 /DNA_END=1562 /DNA_ORIENTATION=-